ncbi:ribosome biogenesis regulatory protein (rrs1) protein [Cardiosporidium cionae]|uniref:Ribosome biogenesis regulatory protein n=1 Tax=Cardiosporidium cionae TaxID=476202 RepID=A0ABQ7JFA4_9APIC|nr:ribosome biogenesis regulatory protein (rrs1) protein [Cardiosporidium cionae]|eukprot:KAF8822325.1 ribosome biogenesis regulatory protein (rrs1) protein [Cardiosporidium cionae]
MMGDLDSERGSLPLQKSEDSMDYCLHHLIGSDIAPLTDFSSLGAHTRENAQLLVNKLFELPIHSTEDGQFAALASKVAFDLPRCQPLPRSATLTRWETFAQEKRIEKRKRSRLVWDETTKDWAPRWGYKSRAKNQGALEKYIELKPGQECTPDLFEERSRGKQIHKTKQKMRELRNQMESSAASLPMGVPNLAKDVKNRKTSRPHLNESMKRAQISTASRGKFDKTARGETQKPPKPIIKAERKSFKEERSDYSKTLQRLLSAA